LREGSRMISRKTMRAKEIRSYHDGTWTGQSKRHISLDSQRAMEELELQRSCFADVKL
jgi:hypothetical protein